MSNRYIQTEQIKKSNKLKKRLQLKQRVEKVGNIS